MNCAKKKRFTSKRRRKENLVTSNKTSVSRRRRKTTVTRKNSEMDQEEGGGLRLVLPSSNQFQSVFVQTNGDKESQKSGEESTEEIDQSPITPSRPSFCCRRPLRKNSSSMINLRGLSDAISPGKARRGNSTDWFVTTTEQFMKRHAYKTHLLEILQTMDRAFTSFQSGLKESFIQGIESLIKLSDDVWREEKTGGELMEEMCDHYRRSGNFDFTIRAFIENKLDLQTQLGEAIEAFLSVTNRDYLIQTGYLRDFVKAVIQYGFDDREHRRRIALALLEPFFKTNSETCKIVVDLGGMNLMLETCKKSLQTDTLLTAAICMSNLALFGGRELRQEMVDKQIPYWLFVLVNHTDLQLRYYSCLTICILASEKSLENQIEQTGTLEFLESFVEQCEPKSVAVLDTKFRSGRTRAWLSALLPMLSCSRSEVQSFAAFQFAMEACLKKGTNSIQVFDDIGAVCYLRDLASCPCNQTAANFAAQVLETIGETVPHRLSQNVPSWSVDDVHFWVSQIGFDTVADKFLRYRVDGDLLLKTTHEQLINEIGMTSSYERMRFFRELNSLKCTADYSALDYSQLDLWLMQLDKSFSVYTYQMLSVGVDRKTLIHLTDDILKNECEVKNGIHRMKILNAIKDVKHVDDLDIAVLRKHVDIFICYRRCNGSQLASLLKVHLQLRGYKVFIDVDRLYAGQFDTSLLKNVRAAKHFILVLSSHALDRCIDDFDCKDWVHIEIRTALESGRNIIPVQDRCFEWPDEFSLPEDMRPICHFNTVNWVHEYQEACIEKIDKFLKGDNGGIPEEVEDIIGPLPGASALRLTKSTSINGSQSDHDAKDIINLSRRRISS